MMASKVPRGEGGGGMRAVTGGALARAVRGAAPGSFSMVMATGIVSAALRLAGQPVPADVVLAMAAAEFVVLAVMTGWRAAALPAVMRADLTCPGRAFAAFAFTAACGVLGAGLANAGLVIVAAGLAAAGAAAWLALTAAVPLRMAVSREARPAIGDISGTWYLWAVATQSLAVMAAFLHAGGLLPARSAAAAGLAAWLAGLVIYLATTALVAGRLRRAGIGPPGARAPYWIAMGGASISVLAAAQLLRVSAAPAVAVARPWITAAAVALWVLATCLILVLAAATAALWLRSTHCPRYQESAWMVVFPLGMYATASMQLGTAAGLPLVRHTGEVFTWPAAAAWALVLAATAGPALGGTGGRARAAAGQRGPSAPRRPERRSAGARQRRPERRETRKYQALLAPLPPASHDGSWEALPWPAVRAVIRAGDHGTRDGQLYTALVTRHDDSAQPGNSHLVVTVVAVGPHPDDCLGIGDHFLLWRGTDIARGVITRRLFT
jgi:tellurite resistance protein TehA-like permease